LGGFVVTHLTDQDQAMGMRTDLHETFHVLGRQVQFFQRHGGNSGPWDADQNNGLAELR
jgi:hypothetical protein